MDVSEAFVKTVINDQEEAVRRGDVSREELLLRLCAAMCVLSAGSLERAIAQCNSYLLARSPVFSAHSEPGGRIKITDSGIYGTICEIPGGHDLFISEEDSVCIMIEAHARLNAAKRSESDSKFQKNSKVEG